MPYFPISVKLVKIVPTKVGLSDFRIIYTVCEECINRGFKKKGYNDCPDCSKTEPDNEMIFFLVGPREKIYCG